MTGRADFEFRRRDPDDDGVPSPPRARDARRVRSMRACHACHSDRARSEWDFVV